MRLTQCSFRDGNFRAWRPRIGRRPRDARATRAPPRGTGPRASRVALLDRARELGEARSGAGQRPRERLAVGAQDLGPELGIAARDAREVAEARSAHGSAAPAGASARAPAKAKASAWGRWLTQATSASWSRGVAPHARGRRAPRRSRPRARPRRAAVLAPERRRTTRPRRDRRGRGRGRAGGCPPSGARRRRRTPGGSSPASVSPRLPFTLPTSVTMQPSASRGAARRSTSGHRADGRREHDADPRPRRALRARSRLRRRSRRAAPRPRVSRWRATPTTRRATPRARAAARDRAAEQPEPDHRDALEGGVAHALALDLAQRSAFTSRSFSSGVPDRDAHVLGHPEAGQRPHDHALAQQPVVDARARAHQHEVRVARPGLEAERGELAAQVAQALVVHREGALARARRRRGPRAPPPRRAGSR